MRSITCPYCRKLQSSEDARIWPFCSERCKNADLGKWAKEEYRVASKESDVEDEQTDIPSEMNIDEDDS